MCGIGFKKLGVVLSLWEHCLSSLDSRAFVSECSSQQCRGRDSYSLSLSPLLSLLSPPPLLAKAPATAVARAWLGAKSVSLLGLLPAAPLYYPRDSMTHVVWRY